MPARCPPTRAILIEAATRIAGWTHFSPIPPDVGVEGVAGRQDCAFDPDDPAARLPRAGDRQGGSRRMPATRLWSQASRRPADGLAGSVEGARTPSARAGVRNDPPLLWADCVEPYSNSRRVDEPRVDETAAIIGAVVERCARGDIALTEIFIDPELAEFLGLANGRPLPHGSGPTVRCEAGLRRQVLFRKA